jgi:hypothetical protein
MNKSLLGTTFKPALSSLKRIERASLNQTGPINLRMRHQRLNLVELKNSLESITKMKTINFLMNLGTLLRATGMLEMTHFSTSGKRIILWFMTSSAAMISIV